MAVNTSGQDITKAGGSVVPTAITSEVLSPTPSVPYTQPKPTTVYPVSKLETPQLEATPTETKASSLETSLASLYDNTVGESSYRADQEAQQGIAQKKQTVTDLTGSLNILKAEADAIPQQLQLDATARGITAGGLRPLETEALRKNAIKSLAVGAQLQAAQGNLTTALDLVDRAVKQRFDPIREEIAAKEANLKLILNSPTYDRETKNRAQAQLDAQNKEKAALEQQEVNQKNILTIATSAAEGGADSRALRLISEAKTPIEALSLAAPYIRTPQAPVTSSAPTSYKEWELAGKPGTYADWLKESNTKAPTVAQQTVSTYAARLEQATPTIDQLESKIASLNPLVFEAQTRLPSYLQTGDFQKFDQAARNFINATLRRESGAVIAQSEFDNAYRQYLPRAGDTAATLAEKKRNRDIVFASFRNAAGSAYQSVDELLGGNQASGQFVKAPDGTTVQIID